MKEKLAIVMSGGGMHCSYAAGVLLALVKKFNLKKPDILIAASGSAGSAAYYVAEQHELIKKTWLVHLQTKKFINKKRVWKLIDVNYLIDEILKKKVPLDVEKIYSSEIDFYIPVTNYKKAQVEFFSNRNKDDIFEALRATKAIPFAFGRKIAIKDDLYCDYPMSSSVFPNIEKAIGLGATKILVIEITKNSRIGSLLLNNWLLVRNRKFKHILLKIFRKRREKNEKPRNINIFVIKPEKKLETGHLTIDRAELKRNIEQGYKETAKNKELEKFLSS